MLCRIEHGRPGGGGQRLRPLVQFCVGYRHQFDRVPVGVLDFRSDAPQALHQVVFRAGPVGIEPLAQFPFLGPGEPDHVLFRAGTFLDQRQGLQNRVMQVGRNFGAFRLPDPARALRLEIPPVLHCPGRKDQRHPGQYGRGGQQPRHQHIPAHRAGNHHKDTGHHQQQPRGQPDQAGGTVCTGTVHQPGPAPFIQLRPGQHGPAGDGGKRQEQPPVEIGTEPLGQKGCGNQEQCEPGQHFPLPGLAQSGAGPLSGPFTQRPGVVLRDAAGVGLDLLLLFPFLLGGDHDPQPPVEHKTGADAQAHNRHDDPGQLYRPAQMRGQAGADTGHNPLAWTHQGFSHGPIQARSDPGTASRSQLSAFFRDGSGPAQGSP